MEHLQTSNTRAHDRKMKMVPARGHARSMLLLFTNNTIAPSSQLIG